MTDREASPRYHALDRIRACAMLLGVVYHSLLFRMMVGGGPPRGFMGPGIADASRHFQEWLHSFRMPLFFLISGFFGRMMLGKYGTKLYLAKRWYRIGIPLVLGMFTFGPAYVLTRDALSSMPGPGVGPPGAGRMGPPGGGMMPGPPGFGPPPMAQAGEGAGSSSSKAEATKADGEMPATPGDGLPPMRFGPRGRMTPGGPMPGPFGPRGGGVSEKIFGTSSRLVQLNHLWFLWYLLVFVTVAPFATGGLDKVLGAVSPGSADRLGRRLTRSGLAPIALGVVGGPMLMPASGPFGWSLGMPASIFRAFPDFLLNFDVLMPFYFLFFLAGWWLHRERDDLSTLARGWLPYLLVGTLAYAASTWMGDAFARREDMPHHALIRWAGFTLYGIASAATGFGFLGLFQTYLDKPSRAWRYLADTALWVYLVHQPWVVVGLAWLAPYRLPWWALTACVTLSSVAASLLLYEAVVRPTFLVRLFGPSSASRPEKPSSAPPSETMAPAPPVTAI